jgi:hypothetical protein
VRVLAGCLLAITLSPAFSSDTPNVPVGSYARVTRSPVFRAGGKETGLLRVLSSERSTPKFRLEVTMNPTVGNDGDQTRNGVIEQGALSREGRVLVYRSAEGEPSLGTCVLAIRTIDASRVSVSQSGKCWWFGEGVDATGVYRRTTSRSDHVVR